MPRSVRSRVNEGDYVEVLSALGRRIRDARVASGLTQEDLAQSLHLSNAYISLIERGDRNPPIATVFAIASVLGVSPRELL
jgi:transcriptional regulator with XRE-family HTH domain